MSTVNRFARRPQAQAATTVTQAADTAATEQVTAAAVETEQQVADPVVETQTAAPVVEETDADVPEQELVDELEEEQDLVDDLEEEQDDEQELEEEPEVAPVQQAPARQIRRGPAAPVQQAPAADAEVQEEEQETGRTPLVTINRARKEKAAPTTNRMSSLVSINVVKRNPPKEHRPAAPGQRITSNELKQRYLETLRQVPGLEDIQKADSDKLLKLTTDFLFNDIIMKHPVKLGNALFSHKTVPARYHAAPISPNVTFIPDNEIIVCRIPKTELEGNLDKTILVPSGDTYIPCFLNEAGDLVQDDDRMAIVDAYLAQKAAK